MPSTARADLVAVGTSDLEVGRSVLATEAAGLRALEAGLDERFAAAVELLATTSGRVVVSGMGKSGHVARKIAATLASTGTPAQFVHPAEASHGDLGMIVAGDAVLALSNSGETAELADLVAHTRRFGVPLVAITMRADSTLALAADVALLLPQAAEACPMGLTPTTSTTMQMAIGDALAVALLTRRGFTAADFRQFHPGGKLGARLRRVRDLMHRDDAMPLAPADLPMDRALLLITEKHFGCLGVVAGEAAPGEPPADHTQASDKVARDLRSPDLRPADSRDIAGLPAGSPPIGGLPATALPAELPRSDRPPTDSDQADSPGTSASIAGSQRTGSPVADGSAPAAAATDPQPQRRGQLIGIVTDGDLRRAMGPDLLQRTVGEVMTHAPRTIGPDALAAEALHAMNARGRPITALFVVDREGRPVGILHIHDLLRAGVA
jgi:arabinose-5-phosphate isomerase